MRKKVQFTLLLLGLSVTGVAQSGRITGKLTYPGEGIPRDTVVCVQTMGVSGTPTYCSNTKAATLKAAKITFKVNARAASYDVRLPAGTYQIYATTREMPGHKAFYNEFVKCGMSIECQSKRPIAIRVAAGKTVKGITVGDFWD